MSEQKQEQVPSLLAQLKQQHAMFTMQRDQAQANLNQLIGAIYACEVMIKKHEDAETKPEPANENQGAINDGEVDERKEEQATQE